MKYPHLHRRAPRAQSGFQNKNKQNKFEQNIDCKRILFRILKISASIIISDITKSNEYDNVVVSLGVQEQHQLLMAKAIRHQVVEKLWEITEKLNILYKDNWTALADREMVKFQTELFAQQKHELYFADDSNNEPSIDVRSDQEPPKTMRSRDEWSFASSFLYSLTLITTVGKDLFTKSTLYTQLVFSKKYFCF